ncbi:hypothetical protein GCM10027046_27710 [Uliginosibacterium flavum]|uniref:Glycosyltransferase n=1 Tax=Uliginosibacterium flavum TaxID=1396831 RepID=A0ABV2TJM0_9RHOO
MSKDFQGKRVAILTAGPTTGVTGGAERFYAGLLAGFLEIGCQAELIAIDADEPDFDTIVSNYRKCAALDLSSFDLVVSSKVPTYAVKHPNHVLYLVHTVRVFDDMFDTVFKPLLDTHYKQRAELHRIDFDAISSIKARFAIGHEVARRLYRWRGLSCDVIHPPLAFNNFRAGQCGDYFFLPGRLHSWKRVDLVIKAIKSSRLPMRLLLAGVGEAEADLRALAGDDSRIEFLGRIDDERLTALYADCLAVPFVPLREDYGYITLEAFASGKPVLTCSDSGEPVQFVRPFETGLIAEPEPEDIRRGLEWFWNNRERAANMGQQAQQMLKGMSWAETARSLAIAGLNPGVAAMPKATGVTVLDMQPIDPPVGGGRLRLLGLYHNLGENAPCTYVGTYDWPGEKFRSHMLSSTLREIDVPLSEAHHAAAAALAAQAGGKVLIDLAFSQQAQLSPEFMAVAHEQLAHADVAIFSHPWVYPLVKDRLRPGQVLIYDAQNVESHLRAQLLDQSNPVEADLLQRVADDEAALGHGADWIIACSHEDLLRFHETYGFPLEKMRVVPNGVMAFRDPPATSERRFEARRALGVAAADFLAIFIGSAYGPNNQAADFIVRQLAPAMPQVVFVIAGGVGKEMQSDLPNVRITGPLDEADKISWLYASDIAINPMLSGSGTNIKMFDFMAMGLPVVSTAIGARGIDTGGRRAMRVADPRADAFATAIGQLQDADLRGLMGSEARLCVEEGYAWERISAQLGDFIKARQRLAGQSQPLFSVVVPTYERHDQLEALIAHLQKQIERDFEVVLVDQSALRWPGAERSHGFPLTYHHSPVKGAVRARNTGAMLAQGKIIAFVDDDCQPAEDWLLNTRPYFADPAVVGVEGLIHSDRDWGDPDWRPVTNVGFEGIGFMTANLFVRSAAFQQLGGFDLQFDRPHFREDSDLGWRMQALGKLPYASNVRVFHPAQPRSNVRESVSAESIIKNAKNNELKVAHLTTTGIKCGIGEYTKRIIEEYDRNGIENLILNCESAVNSVDSMPAGVPARQAWFFDNHHWTGSHIKPDVVDSLKDWGATHVVIQYHWAYYSPEVLLDFVRACIAARLRVTVVSHNYIPRCMSAFKALNEFRVPVFSHRETEVDVARKDGVCLQFTPLGIDRYDPLVERSILGRDWRKQPPVIVTNGYLRRHKGGGRLIAAMPAVIEAFPGAKLVVQSPVYPSEDSQEELKSCLTAIRELRLQDDVLMHTDFLEKAAVLQEVAKADLAVFPYDLSDEGASASAADALSVGLPVVVSEAEVFDGIRGVAITSTADSQHLADAIVALLRAPEQYERLAHAAVAYARENGWDNVAWKFLSYK